MLLIYVFANEVTDLVGGFIHTEKKKQIWKLCDIFLPPWILLFMFNDRQEASEIAAC